MAGSLPVLVGKSLPAVVVSTSLSESELETQASFSETAPLASVTGAIDLLLYTWLRPPGRRGSHTYIMLTLVCIMSALCPMLALADCAQIYMYACLIGAALLTSTTHSCCQVHELCDHFNIYCFSLKKPQ